MELTGEPSMATDSTQVESTVLDRIGEGFTSATEGFVNFLSRLLGSSNDNYVRKLGYIRGKGAGQGTP